MKNIISNLIVWHDIESNPPEPFVSVLGYMTDAGDFPAVREGYSVGIPNGKLYFPALQEFHPVSLWAEMPEPEKRKYPKLKLEKCKLCGNEFFDLQKSGYCGMCKPYNNIEGTKNNA